MKRILAFLLSFLLSLSLLGGCAPLPEDGFGYSPDDYGAVSEAQTTALPDEDGDYYGRDEVALYIHTYEKLPKNYMTKSEARALGWEGGSLEPYAPGMCIGGDGFGNREGLLPEADGRKYTECDVNSIGRESRGAERIVFSNDGLIFYTGDHYESFIQLYDSYGEVEG